MGTEDAPVAHAQTAQDGLALGGAELGVGVHRGHQDGGVAVVLRLGRDQALEVDVNIAGEGDVVVVVDEDDLAGQMAALSLVDLEVQVTEVEEAYLRGEWTPPKGAPDFYEAREFWCSAQWIGPARGFMDPVKEIQATVMAVDNHLVTRHEAVAEYGRDFDDMVETLKDEHKKMKSILGDDESLSKRGGAASPDAAPGDSSGGPADNEDGDEE